MGKGRAKGLAYFDGPRIFDTSLAFLESNWIQTGWMVGWVIECVEKLSEPVVQQ